MKSQVDRDDPDHTFVCAHTGASVCHVKMHEVGLHTPLPLAEKLVRGPFQIY